MKSLYKLSLEAFFGKIYVRDLLARSLDKLPIYEVSWQDFWKRSLYKLSMRALLTSSLVLKGSHLLRKMDIDSPKVICLLSTRMKIFLPDLQTFLSCLSLWYTQSQKRHQVWVHQVCVCVQVPEKIYRVASCVRKCTRRSYSVTSSVRVCVYVCVSVSVCASARKDTTA